MIDHAKGVASTRYGITSEVYKGAGSKTPNSTPKTTPMPQTNSDSKQLQVATSDLQRRCFKCYGLGHIVSEYPNWHVVTLVDEKFDEEIKKDNEEELAIEEE